MEHLIDREKVIKEFEHLLNAAKGNYQDFIDLTVDEGDEIFTLLKEHGEMPFRCKTCAKHTENGFCRRWMQEVEDDDYCSFGERM